MFGNIIHIGVTVSDLDRSIAFYRDTLGLAFQGEILMEGPETEKIFAKKGVKARVAYLKAEGDLAAPPVELIEFAGAGIEKRPMDLYRTGVSEICFACDDIWAEYRRLTALGVKFISEPAAFDFTASGYGKSEACYFYDPDGVILELLQPQ